MAVAKYLFLTPLLIVLLSGCSHPPYKILERSEESMGLVVKIRAEVPADATKEQIESWCAAISADEKTITNIEFIEDGPILKQKAFCLGGQVSMVSELDKLPVLRQ